MRGSTSAFLLAVVVSAAWCHAGAAAASITADGTIDMSSTPNVKRSSTPPPTGTDTNTVEREAQSMSSPVFQRKAREGSQEFQFQAEVSRLMDIIIHSLYSNKDIFLRELISNASDALDKIRFLSLTDKSILGEGDTAKLEIKIWLDPESKVLYIRDRGVGMTRDDLLKNLGTIARSGTSAFLEQMQKGGDMNLIGQFGVGFYSVYLVADWVEVVSKHNDDKQWVWASDASGSFSIAEDTDKEFGDLGRGTLIKIHLKDEAVEYGEESKLRALVAKYSEFISFPIYLETMKEVDVALEEEEERGALDDAKDEADTDADTETESESESDKDKEGEDDGVEDEEEEEDTKEDDKKPKTKKEKVKAWDLLNDVKAIWLRSPSDVTDEEYNKFYKTVSKEHEDPSAWVHFKAEGDVEFRALVFIPKRPPFNFYDRIMETKPESLRLYVRRVFISDDVSELLPRWLTFLRGLVDSDSLPLNVSREMLQAHSSLKTIRKKLVRKVLDHLKKVADDENKCKEAGNKDDDGKDAPECSRYSDFWKEFGKSIKLGIIEDATNRQRLAKLLRFTSSKSSDNPTSLEAYVSRMPKDQKQIYWISAPSQAEAAKSPFLEQLVKKGYEVLYMTDVLDEYVMGQLTEFDDVKLANAGKEDLKVGDEKDAAKEAKEAFAPLTKWWKDQLKEKVSAVKLSNRLATTPCIVVASKYGQTANMERIMRAQALSDSQQAQMQAYMRGQRTLEINPRHPLIKALLERIEADNEDAAASRSAALLFETALLESGYPLDDAKDFAGRMYRVLGGELGVEGGLEAEAEAEGKEGKEEGEDSKKEEGEGDEEDKDEL